MYWSVLVLERRPVEGRSFYQVFPALRPLGRINWAPAGLDLGGANGSGHPRPPPAGSHLRGCGRKHAHELSEAFTPSDRQSQEVHTSKGLCFQALDRSHKGKAKIRGRGVQKSLTVPLLTDTLCAESSNHRGTVSLLVASEPPGGI